MGWHPLAFGMEEIFLKWLMEPELGLKIGCGAKGDVDG